MSAMAAAGARSSRERRRREPELTFLRLVPGDSPVHRLWAGTKLLVATELTIAASIEPTWVTLGVLAVLVAIGLLVADIPLGAFPRLPRGFYMLLGFSLVLEAISTTTPVVHVGPVPISVGALGDAARFLALAVVLVISAALVGWTTPLGSVAPALARLARPLRWLRLPVDEWVVAVALALRCLPMLVEEMRILAAARRLRRGVAGRGDDGGDGDGGDGGDGDGDRAGPRARRSIIELHDLVATAIIVSTRRARDLADAITARGGIGAVSDTRDGGPAWRDAIVLVGITALLTAVLVAQRTI